MDSSCVIKSEETIIFICDIQEKFRGSISNFDSIAKIANKMIEVADVLGVHTVITEQYPKGLGKTVPEVVLKPCCKLFEKVQFSMCIPEIIHSIKNLQIKNVILCGIEAHICILQTAIDLLGMGLGVYLLVDGTSSRKQLDLEIALKNMERRGVVLTTSESVIFQLIGSKDHKNFKSIQFIVKQE